MRHRIVVALAVAFLWALPAEAQNPTGTLSGRVTSPEGALPGVTVSITSPSLQLARSTTTSGNGDYILPLLPPGDYIVTFTLDGFSTLEQAVKISAGQDTGLDAEMSTATVSEEILVTGSLENISVTPQAAVTYEKEFVEELPILRDIRNMALLSPAATDTGPRGANTRNSNIVVSGNMSFENLFLVNGVVINENLRGQPLELFIEDAIEETTITTSGISAEFGRFAGGVINTITKSGGNEFHGSLRVNGENQDWESPTPLTTLQSDEINESYEATLGGYVLRDRLWFFTAGRDFERTRTRQTIAPTLIPFTDVDSQTRLEGKLTLAINAGHRLLGSYIDIDESDGGDVFGDVLDLGSVNSRKLPQELWSANYTGILTENLFLEAQYSERKFQFVGSGSKFTDLIRGTLLVGDLTRGNPRWHSATFCGVCLPEERSNENSLLKASYFLSTERLGAHELVAGYDTFNDIRAADNHQSGSDFRILNANPIVQGTGASAIVYPRFTPGVTVIQWNPIATSTRGSDFKTDSLFLNDAWRVNDRLTLNLGVRYDENDGSNQAGQKVVEDSKISPRIAASWDLRGDGEWIASAGFGRYVAAVANNQADASSAAGNPATITWFYRGPAINTAGGTLLTNEQALEQLFAWFESVGFTDNRVPGTFRSGSVPGFQTQVGSDLKSPHTDEIILGVVKRLGAGGLARVDLVRRESSDFYMDRRDTTTGKAITPFGVLDRSVIENDDDLLERRYDGVHTQFRYRFREGLELGGTYTWSHLRGNVDGETSAGGPARSALGQYPEYKAFPQHNPEGDLAADQRHRARIWAAWSAFDGERHDLNLSLLQNYWSGTPYGAFGNIDTRPFVTNPGYAPAPPSVVYYFTARDAFRTDDITRTDIAVNYAFHVGRGVEVFLQPEVLNILDEDGVELVDQRIFTATNDPTRTLAPFNPFTGTPQEGVNWAKQPRFGQPRTEFDYQQPRTFRLSVGVRF